MSLQLCLFEDSHFSRLLPLVYFRPVYNLKCGMTSLKDKISRAFPKAELSLHCRPYLADYMRVRYPGVRVNELIPGDTLFVNGRLLIDSAATAVLSRPASDCLYMNGEELVAVRLSRGNLQKAKNQLNGLFSPAGFGDLPRVDVDAHLVAYPWHLVEKNGSEIERDFHERSARGRPKKVKLPAGVHAVRPESIVIEEGVVLKPGAVLDAEDGPIHLGKAARVFPNATIIGPVHVGDGSWIKAGAQIYGNTSIGPLCKVGGEVEGTIFQGYSNKQHGGFLGHSYVGAWVNLGADTNNSDLKNNYGPVRVTIGAEQIDTGLQFVGLMMGDHSKSAINSMFNTGTIVGVSSNIFGNGFPPKYVPSFSWGAAGETFTTFNVDKAIDVARRVMLRRKIHLTAQEERLFRTIFDLTSGERRRQGMPQ